MTPRFEVYDDKGGRWRWRFRAGNGQVQFTSHESFASKSNAKKAARSVNCRMRGGPLLKVGGFEIRVLDA